MDQARPYKLSRRRKTTTRFQIGRLVPHLIPSGGSHVLTTDRSELSATGLKLKKGVDQSGPVTEELVEVVLPISLKVLDRLLIHARGPLVGLDPKVGLPDGSFGNIERLCFLQRNPPIAGCSFVQSRTMPPLRSSAITAPSSLLRATPPLCPASVRWLSWGLHLSVSLRIRATGSTFRMRAWIKFTPSLCRPPPEQ